MRLQAVLPLAHGVAGRSSMVAGWTHGVADWVHGGCSPALPFWAHRVGVGGVGLEEAAVVADELLARVV